MAQDFDFLPRKQHAPHLHEHARPRPTRIVSGVGNDFVASTNVSSQPVNKSTFRSTASTLTNYQPLHNKPHPVNPPQSIHRSVPTTHVRPAPQVDPFRRQPTRQTANNPISATAPIAHSPTFQPSNESQPAPFQLLAASQATKVAEKKEKKTRKFLNKKFFLGLTAGIMLVGLVSTGLFIPLLQNPAIAVGAYALIAIIFRLRSQISFMLALLLLVFIPFLLVIKQQGLAETYAVFCFYFLVVGVISSAFELRSSQH